MIFQNEHCPPNPTIEYADSIVLPLGTTEVISQGGGSTIDVGKWIARKHNVKHTAIPTTAGTGAEVTRFCVLTVDGMKTTYEDVRFIPDSYILDPRLVVSLPHLHTLSTGLDALSQALESFWSKKATPESKNFSNTAVALVFENLKASLLEPYNEKLRMNMLLAANLSGRAIDITRTNVCHAISYPLTQWYGIPHGIACAMSLKYFALKAVNLDLEDFLKDLDLPRYDIDPLSIARTVIASKKLKDYPLEITQEDIEKSLVL